MVRWVAVIFMALLLGAWTFSWGALADENRSRGEKISYSIKPFGVTEYFDLGMRKLDGQEVRFFVFRTRVLGFRDVERIYCEPDTLFPIRVERDVKWFRREHIVEEYDQKAKTVKITKYKKQRRISEHVFKADGPIDNAIVLPFRLRQMPRPDIGWERDVWLPHKYRMKLIAREVVTVPWGTFHAYHFSSDPDRVDVWINQDDPQIPLKIKGCRDFCYTMLANKYIRRKLSRPLSK